MASSSPVKRAKCLLKELWKLQKDDVPMTAATLVQVKYLLRHYKRCITVEIAAPEPCANIMGPYPFNINGQPVPHFIWCQLLDQKLIESRKYQDTVALQAALSVISVTYSTEATAGTHVYPTQFRWYCSRTHRSHLIFAYVDVKMRSRVYPIEELLSLRNACSPDVLSAVNFRDNELAEMLRTKSRVSSRSYNSNSLKRGPRKTMEDSSTTSDEIVFKGTIGRRSQRPELIQPTPPVQPLEFEQPARSVQHASNRQANAKATAAAASVSDQSLEWKFRGRSGSEVTTSEPLSAPTGPDAQQNEGFQRFYKAVVSPTHVRVTAGGRIVPNTRNPVSPTTKRPRDGESTTTNGAQLEPAPAAAPTAAPKHPMPMMSMPHPMQYFHPGFFPGMPPIHPMTGMPMPMMSPGYPFSMPQMPNSATAAGVQDTKENLVKNPDDKDIKAAPEPDTPKPNIKLSPPEHFDHTKPFMYNGQQWIFPMFPAPYPGYMGLNSQAFAGPHVPGPPMMMPTQLAMPQMMGAVSSMGIPAPQANVLPPPPPPPVAARQLTPQPPSKPLISSIRPSQITRKQIDGLRANLKYHDDQLQFNKHQIDEKDMENKIQLLNNDIQRFEQVFKAQAEYEEKHYPKPNKVKEDISSSGRSSSVAPSTKTSQSQSEESKESKATTFTVGSLAKLRKNERSRDSIGVNSNKSSAASYLGDDRSHVNLLSSNPSRKSTLPSGAALAPVFQPRSVSGVSNFTVPISKSKKWNQDNAVEGPTQEELDEASKRLRDAGASVWDQAQVSSPISQQESPRGHDNLGVPYLIGILPQGVNNSYPRQRIDYEYNRKLTEEEVQARHLYFGKVARSVSHGLPKYDGRNFYPPSPVKNSDSPSIRRHRTPIGISEADYGCPDLNGKDAGPFRTVTPSDFSSKPAKADFSKTPSAESTRSFNSQAEDHAADFAEALAEADFEDVSEGTRSKDVSETRSVDYHDSRANSTASKLWHNMFKRGLTSSDVLPSTVSSTTAQGFLPHFTGHAVASLSPTLNGPHSPSRESPTKGTDITCKGTSTFMMQKAAENCPPNTVAVSGERLSETLLNMVGIKAPAWAN
ncbi:unnamed protein product [Discula destructiva]